MPSASGCGAMCLYHNASHHPDNNVISRRGQFFICGAVVVVTRHRDICFNTTGQVMRLADIYLLWQSPALFTLCSAFLLFICTACSWGVRHNHPSWKHLGLVFSCNINHIFVALTLFLFSSVHCCFQPSDILLSLHVVLMHALTSTTDWQTRLIESLVLLAFAVVFFVNDKSPSYFFLIQPASPLFCHCLKARVWHCTAIFSSTQPPYTLGCCQSDFLTNQVVKRQLFW